MSQSTSSTSFFSLGPHEVMEAISRMGFDPTGRCQQLNSYENRVYDIELEDRQRVVAKFYRPGRWTRSRLQDEHDFLRDLFEEGIHVVPPLWIEPGQSLFEFLGMFVAVFPRIQGRLPQELLPRELPEIGRLLARIHNVGAQKEATNRIDLGAESMGWMSLEALKGRVYPELENRYMDTAAQILEALERTMDPSVFIRIHGDAHRGNLLHNGSEFFFIDFDDFCNGPAVQDFWMLTGGSGEEQREMLDSLLLGYEELREFDHSTLNWVELLRGLRVIHYSGWIARRWDDPFFRQTFPQFDSYLYWIEELESLDKILQSLPG